MLGPFNATLSYTERTEQGAKAFASNCILRNSGSDCRPSRPSFLAATQHEQDEQQTRVWTVSLPLVFRKFGPWGADLPRDSMAGHEFRRQLRKGTLRRPPNCHPRTKFDGLTPEGTSAVPFFFGPSGISGALPLTSPRSPAVPRPLH